MKKSVFFVLLAVLSFVFVQCAKEGPRGPAGYDGVDGKDGNANVVTYHITDSALLAWNTADKVILYYDSVFHIPDTIRNDGVVLVYSRYQIASGYWYPVPGLAVDGYWVTRLSIGDYSLVVTMYDPDGSPWSGGASWDPELSDLRVILIPPSAVISMARKGIDTDDYAAVADHFGID